MVSGKKQRHLCSDGHQATRAAPKSMTVRGRLSDVAVATDRQLLRWLSDRSNGLTPGQIAAITAAALWPGMWHRNPLSVVDPALSLQHEFAGCDLLWTARAAAARDGSWPFSSGPRLSWRPLLPTSDGVGKYPPAGTSPNLGCAVSHLRGKGSLADNGQFLWSPADIRNTIVCMERKMHGREVPETEIDGWVKEAEAGYDLEELKARMGRPARGAEASQVVPVRLTVDELAAVMARAEREHLNRSEAIRAALAAWSHAA